MSHYVGDDCPGGHREQANKVLSEFTVKDSGQREQFESGMVRDTNAGKTLWHLVADGPMLRRWAEHLTKGAVKYAARNWMQAKRATRWLIAGDKQTGMAPVSDSDEHNRFRESAYRHFMDWYYDLRDEDHASGIFFNVNGAEYTRPSDQITVDPKPENPCRWCESSRICAHCSNGPS